MQTQRLILTHPGSEIYRAGCETYRPEGWPRRSRSESKRGSGMGFQGRDSGQDALGPGSPTQHMSPPKWEALGREEGIFEGPGMAEGLTWSRVRSSSSSLSSSRLRLMRSRRRFSTSGFSICDQQERKSGPTGPRLSAAARAPGCRRWDSPASTPFPKTPESLRPGPFDPSPLPLPMPLGSVSVARLLSLPGLLRSPLSCPPSSPLCVSPPLFSLHLRLVQSLSVSVENFGGPLCAQTRGPQGAGLRVGGPECRKRDTQRDRASSSPSNPSKPSRFSNGSKIFHPISGLWNQRPLGQPAWSKCVSPLFVSTLLL